MDRGKSFSLCVTLKRAGFRDGSTLAVAALCCCSLAERRWGMGGAGRAGGGSHVPFVRGRGLRLSRLSGPAEA